MREGAIALTTVTILDNDDEPEDSFVEFSASSVTVSEGGGSATLAVVRTGDVSSSASVVCFANDGTATAASGDYSSTSQQLNWSAGDSSPKSCTVPILQDTVVEGDEAFNLVLSLANGTRLGSPYIATVTITDDDDVVQEAVLSLTATTATRREGTSGPLTGPVTVSVKRDGGSSGAVSVDYFTQSHTASAGSDFASASGTLTWDFGDTSNKSFTITIYDDSTPELDEQFYVKLTNPSSGAVLGSATQMTVTIFCNDGGNCQ